MYNLNQVETFDNLINIDLKNINKKKQNDFQLFEKYFRIYQKIKSFILTDNKNASKN
tara:strand:- start:941 stop:1111 length:171 start_codon:yes stop_codon:yes gene_type:complete